jgi:hypothetical protein
MTRMLLLLKRSDEQETALQDYLEKQQDKSSASYHQWVTPQEFGALYGPADADIQAVTNWLGQQGFQVNKVYSGKTVIEFSGTAAQVRAAFGAAIHEYQVEGKLYSANANDPQIPAALAPVVGGVVSLNSFPRQSHIRVVGIARKIAGKPGLQPLLTFPNPFGSGIFYGMAPGDFATIYSSKSLISAGNNGAGQTIAIVGETNIKVSDVQAFRQMFGLPANFTSANIILNGEDPGITSTDEEGEADLDVEWSGAVAPGATVDFVVSASTPASAGIDLSALYIIEHNLAGVMSESYGNCEAYLGSGGNAFYNALWEQAAAQGITAMVSAGDGGSAGCDDFNTAIAATQGLAVSGLASTPYNVAVGGTDFDEVKKWTTYWSATNATTGTDVIGTSALSYIPEIPWNENCAQIGLTDCGVSAPNGSLNIVAGSGGPSTCSISTAGGTCTSGYAKPKWQMGVTGMPNDNVRDLPDVSLFASPGFDGTGYVYCQSDSTISGTGTCDISKISSGSVDFGIVGGTSASSPAFAGVMALVNQYQAAHGGTNRQGNANYVLYQLVKKAGASCTSSVPVAAGCVFNDVTHGNSYIATEYGSSVGTNSVPCTGGSPNCSQPTVGGGSGVLVEPTSATTEAWTVTAGYDMVTGLGSVNVNNLATKWGTVSTVPTTTTLTLSSTTGITHGTNENVTVNITVTPKSGTATGDVSLMAKFADGTTRGLEQFTLGANGSVSGTTNSLPGGTNYTVTAHYAGDGTNAPSDSTSLQVTVTPETSQTFMVVPTFDSSGNQTNGNATSAPFGSNYFVRMYVTDKNGEASTTGPPSNTCYEENALTCPTGTVTLKDNGTLLGTGGGGAGVYELNNAGYTRNLTPQLLTGTHTLAAAYSGDNSYGPSSSSISLTVTPAPVSISQQVTSSNPVAGVTFTVTVTGSAPVSYGPAPTGTVTFSVGSTQLGSPVAVAGNPGGTVPAFTATGQLIIAAPGAQTITAQYSGDANYGPATNSMNVTVLYPAPVISSISPTSVNSNGPAFTLTVNGSNFFSASIINFSNNTTFYGYAVQTTFVSGTQLTGVIPAAAFELPGSFTVVVVGPPPDYTPSNQVNFTVNVGTYPVPILGSINPSSAIAGSFPFTLLVPCENCASSAVLNFNGVAKPTVVSNGYGSPYLQNVTATISTADISTPGTVQVTVSNPTPGGGTSNAVPFVITQPTVVPTITSISPSSAPSGYNPPTVTITGTGFQTGATVYFNSWYSQTTVNSSTQLTANLFVNGEAPGTYPLYVIDPAPAGMSLPANFTVTAPVTPSVAVSDTLVALNSSSGTSQTSTVTVTPSGGFTGNVIVSCPSSLPPGVSCPNSPLTITVQSGNTTGQLSIAVVPTSATLSASGASHELEFHFASLISQFGGRGWWGISGCLGFGAILMLLLPGRKRSRIVLGLSALCLLTFALGCGGGGSGGGGGGGGGGPVATSTKLTVANAKVASGNTFSFTATVTGGTLTGQVQLLEGGTALATVGVTAGTASFQTAALPVGTHSISAHYMGDANTLASSSGTLNVTVTGTTTIAITTNPTAVPAVSPISLTIN